MPVLHAGSRGQYDFNTGPKPIQRSKYQQQPVIWYAINFALESDVQLKRFMEERALAGVWHSGRSRGKIWHG